MGRLYTRNADKTLTSAQVKSGGFKSKNNFRYRSNLTKSGFKSGYHESILTTDHFIVLSKAKKISTAKFRMPVVKGFFFKYKNREVPSAILKNFIALADNFRTDTAQTILSALLGKAAAHSGSALSTDGQPGAHDLIRTAAMKILLDPDAVHMSKKCLACVFGAITVTSIAPGELARTLKTSGLKAKLKKTSYEEHRNEAKVRVLAVFNQLSDAEKKFVRNHSGDFLKGTLGTNKQIRRLSPSEPTSPRRGTRSISDKMKSEVWGVGYNSEKTPLPSVAPPRFENDLGSYFTEPFRSDRR